MELASSSRSQHHFGCSLLKRHGADVCRGNFRHLPFPQMAGLTQFYSNAAQSHPARHHPYMSPEASLAVRHRALGELSHPNSNTNEAPRPVKSGRLGVKRRQKYTRSRTGCLGCRARRIKCDEGRPVCRRCVVAKREVSIPAQMPPLRSG